ncbi:PREDICTED: lysM domain-containing GPI-anchored protein 1-like [Nelumbo nucifera]|uniref:LysM domain-containing GPI-anchored protein 1-like n=2 Tax=Nelumbo nucifera TaxID=4432 RepID=A0A1U8ADS1_NELNU|nr:PREDICTED: lysM domain-containing GPI-anchored protein 1-like [Nelumbo nucifera]DAD35339.1 TPA_asm: hypothetical protein HUJ06_005979 [Nelumbo nucifera]
MGILVQPLAILLISLFVVFLPKTCAKFVIEPCKSSDSCTSLLSYLLPWDSKLSEIASRFQVNVLDILGSNSLDPTMAFPENRILPKSSLIRIPISCSCVDGIRRFVLTSYTVRAADTIESISIGYGGLASAEQIRSFNGVDGQGRLWSSQSLVIPLPCTCFNNTSNGITAIYLSYLVHIGENLNSIGATYDTTVAELVTVNGLSQAVVDPGDIVAVPIPACSSANLNWHNESLIVPNGSYALTANNCIKCNCGPNNLDLTCSPSFVGSSCSHLQCKGTEFYVGDIHEEKTTTGCNVTKCLYRGHLGQKIFKSLVSSSQMQCSGNQSNYTSASPTSFGSVIPLTSLSPSPSPSEAPPQTSVFNGSAPVVTLAPTDPSNGGHGVISFWGLSWFQIIFLSAILFYFLEPGTITC